MIRAIQRIKQSILQFFQVQLFLSLASLPILIGWGLPFSSMTALGNFIFNPFLSAFLLFSSLIFFTELLYIPNQWLIFILEHITHWWLYFLSFGNKQWLCGLPTFTLWIIVPCTLAAFLVMQHIELGKLQKSIIALSLLSLISLSPLLFKSRYFDQTQIACNKKAARIHNDNGKIIVHENGTFSLKVSSGSWVEFTFIPELLKKTGSLNIDELYLSKVNGRILEATIALCTHASVKKIIMPYFDKPLSKNGWRLFYKLKEVIKKEDTKLTRSCVYPSKNVS